jgi:hypothetical protein
LKRITYGVVSKVLSAAAKLPSSSTLQLIFQLRFIAGFEDGSFAAALQGISRRFKPRFGLNRREVRPIHGAKMFAKIAGIQDLTLQP